MRTRWRDMNARARGSSARWVLAFSHARSGTLIKGLGNSAFAKIRATGHVRTRPLIERLTALVWVALMPNTVAWNAKEGENKSARVSRNDSLKDCSRIKWKETLYEVAEFHRSHSPAFVRASRFLNSAFPRFRHFAELDRGIRAQSKILFSYKCTWMESVYYHWKAMNNWWLQL